MLFDIPTSSGASASNREEKQDLPGMKEVQQSRGQRRPLVTDSESSGTSSGEADGIGSDPKPLWAVSGTSESKASVVVPAINSLSSFSAPTQHVAPGHPRKVSNTDLSSQPVVPDRDKCNGSANLPPQLCVGEADATHSRTEVFQKLQRAAYTLRQPSEDPEPFPTLQQVALRSQSLRSIPGTGPEPFEDQDKDEVMSTTSCAQPGSQEWASKEKHPISLTSEQTATLDRVTRLAARITQVPVAVITNEGTPQVHTPRDVRILISVPQFQEEVCYSHGRQCLPIRCGYFPRRKADCLLQS